MKTHRNSTKIALALGVVLSIGLSANSQTINFKGGLNSSRIASYYDGVRGFSEYSVESVSEVGSSYKESQEDKNRYGWNASISYEKSFKKRVAVEVGLKFSTSGFILQSEWTEESDSYNGSGFSNETVKMNYLELPVLLKLNFLDNDKLRIYGNAGLTFGIAVSGSSGFTYGSNFNGEEWSNSDESIMDLDEENMRYSTGLIGGVGIQYKQLFLEVNYSSAFMKLSDMDRRQFLRNDLSLSLGYKLKLKK